jgi:outer membrane protein insertion porin family
MRLIAVLAWFAFAAFPAAAAANQDGHLGKTITDVRVEIAAIPATDLNVLGLIETRVGDQLGMRAVRSTIDHLVGLGRFEDVRVFSTPTDQGVSVRWQLTPVRRIAKISITGNAVMPAASVRDELVDRFGALPSTNRVADMVAALEAYYADRGFPRATILPRVEEEDPAPERVELVMSIDAGDRVTIASAQVTGSPLEPPASILGELNVQPGRAYDRPAIDARVAAYEESRCWLKTDAACR